MPAVKRKPHPSLTPQRIAELSDLARKIDREEGPEIKAMARAVFLRHETIRDLIAALKRARVAKHLGLEEVGEKSGIGKANLSRLENHPAPNPTLDTLLRYADAVGVSLRVNLSPA
jgi:DNA-binding phage protein